jgi:hypothetical protein
MGVSPVISAPVEGVHDSARDGVTDQADRLLSDGRDTIWRTSGGDGQPVL